jgi:hypothetical protein
VAASSTLHIPIINIRMEAFRSDARPASTSETRPYKLRYEPAQESHCPLPHLLSISVTACVELLHLQPLTYPCSASPTRGAIHRLSYGTIPTIPHLPPQWKPNRYCQAKTLSVHTCFASPQSFATAFTTTVCLRRRSSLLMQTDPRSLLYYAPAVRFERKHRRFSSLMHSVFQ